jgi:hypothetical protein
MDYNNLIIMNLFILQHKVHHFISPRPATSYGLV